MGWVAPDKKAKHRQSEQCTDAATREHGGDIVALDVAVCTGVGVAVTRVGRYFYLIHVAGDWQYADDDEASFGWALSASTPGTFGSGNNVHGGLNRSRETPKTAHRAGSRCRHRPLISTRPPKVFSVVDDFLEFATPPLLRHMFREN